MIEVIEYQGDYSDLSHLLMEGVPLSNFAAELEGWSVLVGYEDGPAVGYVVLSDPTQSCVAANLNPLRSAPFVSYLYNSGSTEVRVKLCEAIKAFYQSKGYNSFIAMNVIMPNETWMTIFKEATDSWEHVGSIFQATF
jgi:hypothetical protein